MAGKSLVPIQFPRLTSKPATNPTEGFYKLYLRDSKLRMLDWNGNEATIGPSDITQTQIDHWDEAYSWGNHALAGYVPQTRTITINGVTQDLSTNRSWNIVPGTWGQINGNIADQADLQAALLLKVNGSGTNNYVPKWTAATRTLTNSIIYENGGVGIGTTAINAQAMLHVVGGLPSRTKSLLLDSTWDYQTSFSMKNGNFSAEFNLGGATKSVNEGGPGSLQVSTYNASTGAYRYPMTFFASGNVAFSGVFSSVPTDNGNAVQVRGSIQQTSVTSAMLKANASGVLVAAVPNVDYLVSVATPTLDSVTTAGNTTNNSIVIGGLTAAVNTLYVDPTFSNVGIGTTSPTSKLQVEGTTRINGQLLVNPNVYTDTVRIWNDGYSNTNGTQLIIAQQSTGYTFGTLKLESKGINSFIGMYDSSNAQWFGILGFLGTGAVGAGLGGYYKGAGIQGTANSSATDPVFGVLNTDQQGNGIGNVSFTIYANKKIVTYYNTLDDGFGNMLLGTTSSSGYKLNVVGVAKFSGGSTAGAVFGSGTTVNLNSDAYMLATSTAGKNAGYTASRYSTAEYASFDLITSANTSSGWSMQMTPGNTRLEFVDRVNSATRVALLTTGDVGIGTTSPNRRLEVYHAGMVDGQTNGIRITAQHASSTARAALEFYHTYGSTKLSSISTDIGNGGNDPSMYIVHNSLNVLKIASNGNVLIGTTTDAGYKLDVTGSARVNGAITFATDGSGGNYLNFYRASQNYWIMGSAGVGTVMQIIGNTIYLEQDVYVKRGGLAVVPTLGSTALYVKSFGSNASNYALRIQNSSNAELLNVFESGATVFINTVTASGFVKSGGTSAQFLKADGSVDNTIYLSNSSLKTDYTYSVIGAKNGVNVTFTTTSSFATGTTRVYLNGVRLTLGASYDYVETGNNQITFIAPPDPTDQITIDYQKL